MGVEHMKITSCFNVYSMQLNEFEELRNCPTYDVTHNYG